MGSTFSIRNDGILAAFLVLAAGACGGRAESSTNKTSGTSRSSGDSPSPSSNVISAPTDTGETNASPPEPGPPGIYWAPVPAPAPEGPGLDAGPDPEPFAPGAPVECSASATADVPYANEAQLDALIIGEWTRCEGTIQPIGGSPAPDGQNALEFGSYVVPPDASAPPGGWLGAVLPGDPFDAEAAGGVLVYVGGTYSSDARWWFLADSAGNPGIAFAYGSAQEASVLDRPVFTDAGNKMVLFDSLWHGIYIRVR